MSETKIKRVKLLNGDIYDIGVNSSNVTYDGSQVDIQGKDLTDALETIIDMGTENDNVIEIVKVNGTTLPVDGNKAVNVPVPTKTSDLQNDSDYLTPETLTYNTDTVVKSYPGTTTSIYPAANIEAVTGITYSTQAMYGTGTTNVFATATVNSDKVLSFGTASVANSVSSPVVISASPSATASVRDAAVTALNGLGNPVMSTVISEFTFGE